MRTFKALVVVMVACAILLAGATVARADEHTFVGVGKCKLCHNSADTGDQFGIWSKSPHADAYKLLGTDKAKEVGKKKGVADPQKSEQCLKCHVTAFGVPKEQLGEKYSMEDGIGCESCHGPGSDYTPKDVMENKDDAVNAGLIIPNEKTCQKCHNESAPTWDASKPFKFDEMVAKIAHKNPKKKK